MKIISWNINGLRAVVKKGFVDFLSSENPDIIGLQEIKISDNKKDLEKFDFSNYEEFWNCAKRPGYSGTLILFKTGLKVLSTKNGIGLEEFDNEGRVQTIELEKFYFVNTYFPNSNHELSRLSYKIRFNNELLKYLKKLEKKKPVIITGDFNVAHNEIDLARPKENVGNPGFTAEERSWMDSFLKQDFVDSFRHLHPQTIKYSWWSYRAGARQKNVGWRIDYFCISKKLISKISDSDILDKVLGSDHAPVVLKIK